MINRGDLIRRMEEHDPANRTKRFRAKINEKITFKSNISNADKERVIDSVLSAMGLFKPVVGEQVAHIDDKRTYYIRRVEDGKIYAGLEKDQSDEDVVFEIGQDYLFDPAQAVEFTQASILAAERRKMDNAGNN